MIPEEVRTGTRRICWPTFTMHCLADECPYCQDHDHQAFLDIRTLALRRGIASASILDPLLTSQAQAWWNEASLSEAEMTEAEKLHAKLTTVTAERDELRALLEEVELLLHNGRPAHELVRSRPAHARTPAHARKD